MRAPVETSAAQGEADVVVRTFVAGPDARRAEVGGAVCEVTSLLFSTRVATPARLAVPSFGPQSVTLNFDCRAGELTGAAQQGVVTRWVQAPGAWGSAGAYPGAIGPVGWGGPWGGGAWGGGPWGGGAFPVFLYPDVNVVLE